MRSDDSVSFQTLFALNLDVTMQMTASVSLNLDSPGIQAFLALYRRVQLFIARHLLVGINLPERESSAFQDYTPLWPDGSSYKLHSSTGSFIVPTSKFRNCPHLECYSCPAIGSRTFVTI